MWELAIMKLTCYWITHRISESVQCYVATNRFASKVLEVYIKSVTQALYSEAFHCNEHQLVAMCNKKLIDIISAF